MFEQIISYIAPHICLGCQKEGSLLCSRCQDLLPEPEPHCYKCRGTACQGCQSLLKSVFIATEYNGLGKKLIHHLKFERAAAAANPIAQIMMARLSLPVSPDTVISFVPTATARVRIRGYDQALLIARHLAAEARTDTFVSLLTRLGHQRQVGQTKAVRHEQLRHAFQVNDPAKVATKRVLLIDDVLTTGSTLESAAQALYEAGAEGVDAAVFAGA